MTAIARRVLLSGWLGLGAFSCAPGSRTPAASADVTPLAVTRPTVIAYFVVPAGAVDTMPDLAVEADDWNYAMAMLGDSLEASGMGLAIMTKARVRISVSGMADTTLALGEPFTSGYAFVRPGEPPCIRRGAMEQDALLARARGFFTPRRAADRSC